MVISRFVFSLLLKYLRVAWLICVDAVSAGVIPKDLNSALGMGVCG